MNIGIQEQIEAQQRYVRHLEDTLPRSIAENRITVHRAEQMVMVNKAIANTLIQLKRLAQGEEPKP